MTALPPPPALADVASTLLARAWRLWWFRLVVGFSICKESLLPPPLLPLSSVGAGAKTLFLAFVVADDAPLVRLSSPLITSACSGAVDKPSDARAARSKPLIPEFEGAATVEVVPLLKILIESWFCLIKLFAAGDAAAPAEVTAMT